VNGSGFFPIVAAVAALACIPLMIDSNVVLNFLVMALLLTLAGQGWNILGGYGGQYSFGHAAFFGTGAYATAILQTRYGLNAWPAFAAGIAAGAGVGAAIGALTFRSGLRGSYFALVTLAFAEVLRIPVATTFHSAPPSSTETTPSRAIMNTLPSPATGDA
jgi:branched-chain amino acid transport system permease protein